MGVPLRDGLGAVRGVLCVTDTEPLHSSSALTSLMHTFAARAEGELQRRQRETELRRRSAELARSQRIARIGSWHWDPATNEIAWSDEQFRVYGMSPGEFRPTYDAWMALIHPEDRATVQATLASAIAAHRTQLQNEFRILRPDGTIAWIATIGEVEYSPDGRPLGADGVDQDVSERKSLEAQLRQSQKMEAVGLLAGGVAHDFNNLLTVIRGNADFLLGALPDASQAWADAEEVRAAADRAAALTRQLLAFSRRQVLQPRVLEVDDVVAGVEKLLRRVIGEDIRLGVRMEAGPAPVLIDPGQLEQVLLNLAVNARDAMQGGGALEIVTRRVDGAVLPRRIAAPHGAVVIGVRDTGHGMDEATLARAFEPFFTTKEAGHGTGLGLATVFGIVEQSGGTVWLESTVGVGTSVMVALPVADVATAARVRPPDLVGPRGDGLVMVVEDDDSVRSLARRTLVRAGYGVIEARSGREALRLWDAQGEQVPQALVTDVVMPDMGGIALAQALRERHPSLPILFLSGYAAGHGSPADVGAPSAFVEKPFATDALLAAVASLLQPAPR
jgi:PAS domain S-box-containing protein